MEKRRVVITGMGTVCPVGNSIKTAWDSVKNGKTGISTIKAFDTEGFPSRIAGEVKDLEFGEALTTKEGKRMDLFSQYALCAAYEAWQDSGLKEGDYDASRFGCILGVGMGGMGVMETNYAACLKGGPRKYSPFFIPMLIPNLSAGHVGIRFGLKGVNFSISSACASSTHAIGEAARMIASGSHEKMMTGGTESTVVSTAVGGFASMRALSTRNDDPEHASRPFDKGRDGFVIAEGSAVFVLEEYEAAKARGAQIYAEVKGYGASCDAGHMTAPDKEGLGASQCMQTALADAGLNPEDIQYVNAHGTSTPLGDIAETAAIKKAFGAYAKEGLQVSSTKSMTGHLLGAAGAVEAAFCAMSIKEGVIAPTINLEDQDEACDLDYVPNTARESKITYAMSNSFGFGGTNGTVILGAV